MACIHVPFAFASPPDLATLVDRFQNRTGLQFWIEHARYDAGLPGVAYDDSATVILSSGETVVFFRSREAIAVEFLPGAWRQDYLAQAALRLVAHEGGRPEEHLHSPRWAEKAWADVPKLQLVGRWIGAYSLLALLLPLTVLVGLLASVFSTAGLRRLKE